MPETRSLHRNTPSLVVHDPRNLVVRQVAYHRAAAPAPALRRITATRLAPNGQWQRQWDPRLLDNDSAQPSQQTLASFSGRTLWSESRDAGWTLSLPGEAGETNETWDTRGNHWQTDYDELRRPVLIHETAAGQPGRVAECFAWSTDAGSNRRGRLVRHDDEAGTRLIKGYSLTGAEREETRYLLPTLDLPDWPAQLDPDSAANSTWRHSPLGEVLERIDALGNHEHSRFNLGGQLCAISLELAAGSTHPLLSEVRYNAFGQIEGQNAGNGVISHAEYDPADGRLKRLSSNRPGRSKLQDLHYTYDRVGNVIRIEDHSQPVRHFANQRIAPASTFAYDTLYQLIEATGREAAGAMIGPALPDLTPNPGDTSRLLNYRQLYEYDASGNLLSLRHEGQRPYTRTMNVAEDSNRAVAGPGDPLTGFDANGNLRELQASQPLHWNARNQLHSTPQVLRHDGENDEEHYRYRGDGLRARKVVTRLVAGRMQKSETRYLPGLELHTLAGERFAVITCQAGRCSVRCLVWSEGQPEGIANPQLRYSLDDLHDSSGLELDDAANIISHEGYYPFGGTAWWASNAAIEAGYKSRRYSGKERDSTGLYYYGLRYYAPWLMRWINPDPAGDRDGLNRYAMVRNNPVSLRDDQGLMNTPRQRVNTVPKKTEEEHLQFVEDEFEHDFSDPYTMQSVHIGEDGQRNLFEAEFTEDLWTIKMQFKRSPLDIFASDVVIYQYQQVAEEYGFTGVLPSRIKYERVVTRETVGALASLKNGSEEMRRVFLNETVNGKSTQYLLQKYQLQALSVSIEPTSWGQDNLLVSAHIYVDVAPLANHASSTPAGFVQVDDPHAYPAHEEPTAHARSLAGASVPWSPKATTISAHAILRRNSL